MLWIVFWYFLYVCDPHPLFHVAVAVVCAFRKRKTYDAQSCVGGILMYTGYYVTKELFHFAFLPFWCITLAGLRVNTVYVFVWGVATGLAFYVMPLAQVAGHVLMNVGRVARVRPFSAGTTMLCHGVVGAVVWGVSGAEVRITLREALAVASTLYMINKEERMDIFSLAMGYSHFWTLPLLLLHGLVPNYYNRYENNHFYVVKHSFLYFVPLVVICQRMLYQLAS